MGTPLNKKTEQELKESIEQATDAVNRLESRLADETKERKKQNKRTAIGLTIGAILLCLTIIGVARSHIAVSHAEQAQHKADEIIREIKIDTQHRVEKACQDSADDKLNLILTLKSGHRVIIEALVKAGNAEVTSELKTYVKVYYQRSDADIDIHQRIRDCSPAAIAYTLAGNGYKYLPPSAAPQLPQELNI